jgi:hypothetical protein
MNLYLDIEGVLLDRGESANGLKEFIGFAVENFDCYWLSTHCDGEVGPVLS